MRALVVLGLLLLTCSAGPASSEPIEPFIPPALFRYEVFTLPDESTAALPTAGYLAEVGAGCKAFAPVRQTLCLGWIERIKELSSKVKGQIGSMPTVGAGSMEQTSRKKIREGIESVQQNVRVIDSYLRLVKNQE